MKIEGEITYKICCCPDDFDFETTFTTITSITSIITTTTITPITTITTITTMMTIKDKEVDECRGRLEKLDNVWSLGRPVYK